MIGTTNPVANILRLHEEGLYTRAELPNALLRALAESASPIEDRASIPPDVWVEIQSLVEALLAGEEVIAIKVSKATLESDAKVVRSAFGDRW